MREIRMLSWLVVALVLSGVIAWVAPHQVAVSVYKLSLVSMAAVVGYWVDRALFPYGRPDRLGAHEVDAAMLRRAIVVGACIVGVSLGA